LADQNGTLPLMFTNADMRKSYGNLIEEKMNQWENFGSTINASVSSRTALERYTRHTWQEQHSEIRSHAYRDLDDEFGNMIKHLTKCVHVINEQRLSTVKRERRKEMETLLGMLVDLVKPLEKLYRMVSDEYFTKDVKDYFSNLISSIKLKYEVQQQMRLSDEKDVPKLAFGLILMWRHIKIVIVCKVVSPFTPPLPLPLSQWMMSSPFTADSSVLSHDATLCWPGQGGKRRIRCILAGLTYFWLQERCIEWKSETAAQELLTDFDMEVPTDKSSAKGGAGNKHSGSTSKSSKRNKKKKGKGSKVPEKVSGEENQSNCLDQQLSEVAKASQDEKQEPGHFESMTPEEDTDSDSDDDTPLLKSNEIAQVTTKNGGAEEDEDVTGDNGDKCYVQELLKLENELDSYKSAVVVQDENLVVSAQDFLTSRMLHLMNEAENGNNIIIIS
jgi:hypothetical protein